MSPAGLLTWSTASIWLQEVQSQSRVQRRKFFTWHAGSGTHTGLGMRLKFEAHGRLAMDFDSTNQKVKFAIQTESKDSQIANHL